MNIEEFKKEKLNGIYKEVLSAKENFVEGKKEMEEQKRLTIQKDVILFFSFDVVNSTAYKTVDYYGWAHVLNRLFKVLQDEVKSKITSSQMWRVLGDEAIFIVKIKGEDELRNIINKIFVILISTIYKIKTGDFFCLITRDKDKQRLMKLQNILSLKAAAWIAAVSNIGDIDENEIPEENPELENIFEKYQSHEGYEIYEFLGNDIDAGFRIAKYALDGKFVISFELAYLISQITESVPYLHIITYKKLKGVWKDKLYPIIWYHNPKAFQDIEKKEITLKESLPFDAREEHELIREYFDNADPNSEKRVLRDIRMFTEVPYALEKILDDRGLRAKIKGLQDIIKNVPDIKMNYLESLGLQFHCAAVCFKYDKDAPKILVAKRSENKNILPGCWEFGCAKITAKQSIVEKVKEDYRNDFGIKIDPVIDLTREDKQPVPMALYQIESGSGKSKRVLWHKGTIILAEVIEEEHFKLNGDKYSDYAWVGEDDCEERFQPDKCVNDFISTLRTAFEKIEKIEKIGKRKEN